MNKKEFEEWLCAFVGEINFRRQYLDKVTFGSKVNVLKTPIHTMVTAYIISSDVGVILKDETLFDKGKEVNWIEIMQGIIIDTMIGGASKMHETKIEMNKKRDPHGPHSN